MAINRPGEDNSITAIVTNISTQIVRQHLSGLDDPQPTQNRALQMAYGNIGGGSTNIDDSMFRVERGKLKYSKGFAIKVFPQFKAAPVTVESSKSQPTAVPLTQANPPSSGFSGGGTGSGNSITGFPIHPTISKNSPDRP